MTTSTTAAGEIVRDLFAAVDRLDADAVAPLIADDVAFRFASAEPVAGKADFLAVSRDVNASLAGLRHEVTALWEPEPGVVVALLEVHYRRHDGGELTLPCCSVFRVRDGLIADYRIFMDIAPVFAG